eukprot:jgi/Botrbrau1/1416/Bobra.0063s0112.1
MYILNFAVTFAGCGMHHRGGEGLLIQCGRVDVPFNPKPGLPGHTVSYRKGGRFKNTSFHGQVSRGKERSAMQSLRLKATIEGEKEVVTSAEELAILKADPNLRDNATHLLYQWKQYQTTKRAIEAVAGSLEEFAKGYETMGFNRKDGVTVYREWAPAAGRAALIGDFNNWEGIEMQRDQFGVWSVSLPDREDGQAAIPHGSRVKIRLWHPKGYTVDRIPAWIKWATAQKGVMGARYDGIYWDPPPDLRYKWKHKRPPKPKTLRIYEAHVGMSSEESAVASYTYFKDNILPRIAVLGYNAVQLMAVQEHAYYASFGYHVTNPFAVSSWSGNPEELKALVDEAHRLGLYVLLDVVHSHISSNEIDGIAGYDFGQGEEGNYFYQGERGHHKVWGSRLLVYRNWEVLRYLLSNVRWWLDEYRFDGFRFDGVTSMLYWDHGINTTFSGDYREYFSPGTNVDAVVYLMLANEVIHKVLPQAVTVAEDVSGMPGLGRPVEEGGVGFDYRLGMGLPDTWFKLIRTTRDEQWDLPNLVAALCNRRYSERTIAYVESHDQAIVGDQTLAFRLMGPEMYTSMSALSPATPVIARGMRLHKIIRLLTIAIGGEGWLSFMGNEFGHPEWIDFPRDENGWSYQHCRRQWSLVDRPDLRYRQLNAWDAAIQNLEERFSFLSDPHQLVSFAGRPPELMLVAERGPLVFVFNFCPTIDREGYKVGVGEPGKYRIVLDSDDLQYGGLGRLNHTVDHFTSPEGIPGVRETNFNDRPHSMLVFSPARSAVVYARVPENGSNGNLK